MATDAARREPYIGEKHKFLRNGYGVYVYENQYFRYEGEWKNGKKHGHGKLLMKDGTYYEGQFVNGEINGHGYKYFSGANCKYTGQFLNGEMHGHGVMQYRDESIYEGQWVKNKKQGFGVLRTTPKSVYEGAFAAHHKNGEGTQTYDNGDRYEGYWVMDQRHGHGELFCADGSYYVGQFMYDLYHGDGKMQHASGMLYVGQWLHGFPTRLASEMIIIVEESPLTIRQGQPFKIAVKCIDEDGDEVVEDLGREIQVTAGFKYFPPKQGSVLFDMIEDVEEKPVSTPFGYDVVSYPLTDQLSEEEVVEDDKGDKAGKDDDLDEKGEDDTEREGGDIPDVAEGEEEGKEPTALSGDDVAGEVDLPPSDAPPAAGSNPASPSQEPNPEMSSEAPAHPTAVTPVEATPLPPPVPTKRTEGGIVEWNNLQLSPPPPLYRPFVAMDEEKKSSKKMSLKDKFEKRGSQIKMDTQKEKTAVADEKFARTDEKEVTKVRQEKTIPRDGEYVLMVHDVTTPPFLGKRLEPAFLLLKLKRPKKIIVKKPKWDTQRHIMAAMQARYSSGPDA